MLESLLSQHSLKSVGEIPGELLYESWTGSYKVLDTRSGPLSDPLCKEEQDKRCQSPKTNDPHQTTQVSQLSDSMRMALVGPVLSAQQCVAWLGFNKKHQKQEVSGTLFSLQMTASFILSTRDRVWRSCAYTIIQHDWSDSRSVIVRESLSLESCTGLHVSANNTLTECVM